ncbi:hypothetical protein [Promicromonospora sp. NPDC090134]|uniref:hypothetical protein n=1 Tax=Promicromonospora sp. NPDC090134 TaxID=3364408 RepID=UPI00382ED592
MERLTRGGLLLVAVGSVANLLLAFVPNLLDDRITTALVVTMSLLLVVLGVTFAVRLFRDGIARAELQRLRGISKIGHARKGTDQFTDIFQMAERSIVCCGVGMTKISRSPGVVKQAVARGVQVHFVMPEPRWLRWDRTGRRLTGGYYGHTRFDVLVQESHAALARLGKELNAEFGEGAVTIHTHRMFMPLSLTVADPGTTRAVGVIEHHYFGGAPEARFWLEAKHYESDNGNPAILEIAVAAISQLTGHDFNRDAPAVAGRPG